MKKNFIAALWDAFNNLLYKNTILLLFYIFSITLLSLLVYWTKVSHEIINTNAMQNVASRAEMLEELRVLYTNDVVNRAIPYGIGVEHKYKKNEDSIPHPLAFTSELSKRIKDNGDSSIVRLFSDHPPKQLKNKYIPKDDFEKSAMRFLKRNPREAFIRFEKLNGKQVLRYAIRQKIKSKSINVLEVIYPMDTSINLINNIKQISFILFLSIGVLGVIVISAVINKLKHSKIELEETVKERTKDLERSNEELEQFAYVASHDLQEPLRMVASFTQLLQEEYKEKLNEEANSYINFAVDGAKRMQGLISDLLEYSRVGRMDHGFKMVDCNEIYDLAIRNLHGAIIESNSTITKDQLPTVQGVELRLAQLFQNLIGNAIKYRGDIPPKIHVKAESKGDSWVFSFQDNGIGIDSKYAERIFQIFQRLHARDKYSGTGIGLALCKKIVEHHKGKIWVESQEGKGSTFYFTMPKL